MQTIAAIGLDIAKSVFQVHEADAAAQVVVRRIAVRQASKSLFAGIVSAVSNPGGRE
jgi:transposase